MNKLQNKYLVQIEDVSLNHSYYAARLLENYFDAARRSGSGVILYEKLKRATQLKPETQKKVLTFFVNFCKDHNISVTEFLT
jgi:hypothetical protein